MHAICWDSDMPDEACKYMHESQSSGSSSLRVYCAACIKFVDKLREFDSRLRTLEGKISVQNDANFQGEPLVVNLPPLAATYAAAVTNCKSTPQMQGSATANIQREITEAMEQEKRKKNLVVFNLKTSTAGDNSRLTALFEHVTGACPPAFRSRRIGKPKDGKPQPVVVEFTSELDRLDILKSSRKLKDLQAEWPHVGIAPDRTKRQLEQYRQQRAVRDKHDQQSLRTDADQHRPDDDGNVPHTASAPQPQSSETMPKEVNC